jgi:hypothetical protein
MVPAIPATAAGASPSATILGTPAAVALLCCAVIGIGLRYGAKYMVTPSRLANVDDGEVVVELLELERAGVIHTPSVTTITFYTGHISAEYLETRLAQILVANPWLDSRLMNLPNRGGACAAYHPSRTRFNHFKLVRGIKIDLNNEYTDIALAVKPFTVKVGRNCIDKDESLFKVTLVEMVPDEKYALVISLNHILGDGHTYYRIYNMFNPTTPVESLIAVRETQFMGRMSDIQGLQMSNWLKSPWAILGFLGNALYGVIAGPPNVCMHEIDLEGVEREKKNQLDGKRANSFLSSNDVITATFFAMCKSDFSMMALNFRNRVPILTDRLAGNYEGVIVYDNATGGNANMIRESLTSLRNPGDFIPSVWQSLRSRSAVASNWSTFYEDLLLPNGCLQAHFPAVDPAETIFMDVIVIFRLSSKKLGVLYGGRSYTEQGFFESCRQVLGTLVLPLSKRF